MVGEIGSALKPTDFASTELISAQRRKPPRQTGGKQDEERRLPRQWNRS
jgi:hypothetical protein